MMKGWKGRGKGKKEGMDEIDEINETIERKEGMDEIDEINEMKHE